MATICNGILEEHKNGNSKWNEIQELKEASKVETTSSDEQVSLILKNQNKEGSLSAYQGKKVKSNSLVTSSEFGSDLSVNVRPSFDEVDDSLLCIYMQMDGDYTLVEYDCGAKFVIDCGLKDFQASVMSNYRKT
ncbi:hypothetical protein RND71_001916 [Anisodus tanguticus]|uniref:Uncharacterized protein n=1 Tax=Anisodus tanguticus TaxID=243964 RepID=A0AAE1T061_9SOLA|nr:hypothetical protein RND71_001916 [Anisodus tanguticus]